MLKNFNKKFIEDYRASPESVQSASVSFVDDQLGELISNFGGASFNNGIYRIASLKSVLHWNDLVIAAFPYFSGRITCFSMDWLGRIFALDSARTKGGRAGILMFEPGTGEVLEIPCNIESFHEDELINYSEEALAENFYKQWLAGNGAVPCLTQCIGYKKPLFLGGSDVVSNLELSDLDVYWSVLGQLIHELRELPPGSQVGKFSIE